MKKLIKWLAKVFDVNIVTERIVTKEVVKEVVKYLYLTDGVIDGDVIVKGDLIIEGSLTVSKSITCYKDV